MSPRGERQPKPLATPKQFAELDKKRRRGAMIRAITRIAVAWTLHHPAITAAIVGGRSAEQVRGMATALQFKLSNEAYAQINEFIASNPA